MSTFQAGRYVDEDTAGPISDTLCRLQCGQPALCSPLRYMSYIPLQMIKSQTQSQGKTTKKHFLLQHVSYNM